MILCMYVCMYRGAYVCMYWNSIHTSGGDVLRSPSVAVVQLAVVHPEEPSPVAMIAARFIEHLLLANKTDLYTWHAINTHTYIHTYIRT